VDKLTNTHIRCVILKARAIVKPWNLWSSATGLR
jgi:hypothetical protein